MLYFALTCMFQWGKLSTNCFDNTYITHIQSRFSFSLPVSGDRYKWRHLLSGKLGVRLFKPGHLSLRRGAVQRGGAWCGVTLNIVNGRILTSFPTDGVCQQDPGNWHISFTGVNRCFNGWRIKTVSLNLPLMLFECDPLISCLLLCIL